MAKYMTRTVWKVKSQPNNNQTAIKVQVRAQKKCHCPDNLRLTKIDYNGQQLSMDCLNLAE